MMPASARVTDTWLFFIRIDVEMLSILGTNEQMLKGEQPMEKQGNIWTGLMWGTLIGVLLWIAILGLLSFIW